jgi:hypothetical protein
VAYPGFFFGGGLHQEFFLVGEGGYTRNFFGGFTPGICFFGGGGYTRNFFGGGGG